MLPMRFNWDYIRQASERDVPPYVAPADVDLGFPIHPSASELAEALLVDPEALKNETYEPGIYDEDGDYYPQYTDDPSKLPEAFAPNDLSVGDTAPESSPASDSSSTESVSSETDSKSE